MSCFRCGEKMIWGGDHTYEDYGMDGDGIVANLSFSKCECFCLFYTPIDEEEDNGEEKNQKTRT